MQGSHLQQGTPGRLHERDRRGITEGLYDVDKDDVLESLEDFSVTMELVAIAGKWKPKLEKSWEEKGLVDCQELIMAD